jgi:hypothetical protein
MKSFILALALFASTIGIAQITKAETGGREGGQLFVRKIIQRARFQHKRIH